MDQQTQDKLNQLLKKEPLALTQTEVAFLKARSSYLSPEQLDIYAEVFGNKPEVTRAPRLERSRSYRAMQRELSALGYHVVGVPREELERTLDTIHGPGR